MAKMSKADACSLLWVLFLSLGNFSNAYAYTEAPTSKKVPKVEFLKPDNVTNQIPYFDNRFRIDAELDEITLLFYRKSGTPPIILIRPDGSKLKINNAPRDRVEWFDDRTFDMIKIKKPMPGPWQALGDILPNSQIMVVSDIRIEVEPLPEIILSGETLKVTGRLYNGDLAIDTPDFRDVVNLDVDFYSTNNSAYDNFGALPIKLTTFRDDGRDLDEYANDNIFTGEFTLDFAPGEWVPVYQIKLPMANRELRQKPVILQPSPITISVEEANDELEFHKVRFGIDPTYVDPDSMVFQGSMTFPDRQAQPFSILEGKGEERIEEFGYTEPGIHRVKVGAYGKTIDGREFRLIVPEFTFNIAHKEGELLPTLSEPGESAADVAAEQALKQIEENAEQLAMDLESARLAEEEKQQESLIIIIAGNGLIILIALAGFFVYRWRKRKQAK